jgi:asparagine synthase (glutamine-hydrolysing)
MCGLAGFTGQGTEAAGLLSAMLDRIAYRGPDERGALVEPGVALGWLRLAVVAPEGGHQPIRDAVGGDALIFNGEIYAYRALGAKLAAQGVVLRDRSDSEVLFQALRLWGVEKALEKLDGMFAFAFRRGSDGVLTLARDRFGEKPLFYAVREGRLVFASEIKALLFHPLCRDSGPDGAALLDYLRHEFVPGEATGWTGIRRLPPGHLLRWDGRQATVTPYWRPPAAAAAADAPGSIDEAAEAVEADLARSVAERLVADVPVGLFLSGGLDSSLIAAMAMRQAPDITAFSVRMPEGSYDETPYTVQVAEHLGLRHEIVPLDGGDLVRAFETVTGLLDEPMADASLIPTYLVCEAAKRRVTVALGGDGADELFAGYGPFRLLRAAPAIAAIPAALGRLARWTMQALPHREGYMSLDFLARQLSQGAGVPTDLQWQAFMSPFPPEMIRQLVPDSGSAAAGGTIAGPDPLEPWRREAAGRDPVDRLSLMFLRTYMPGQILTKVDRASMYNSLEVRAPFLDRRLAERALSLPSRFKVAGGVTKAVLRRIGVKLLPREVTNRPKQGFAPPISAMMRGPLRELVGDVLSARDHPLDGWLDQATVMRLWDEHQSRRRDHRKRLYTLFVAKRVFARAGSVARQ